MNWNKLISLEQLDEIDNMSFQVPVLIFKHSTRCSISSTALSRLERNWNEQDALKVKPYYLDLLNHREISNDIERRYNIEHQSPQILVIAQGKCMYTASHLEIRMEEIRKKIEGLI